MNSPELATDILFCGDCERKTQCPSCEDEVIKCIVDGVMRSVDSICVYQAKP